MLVFYIGYLECPFAIYICLFAIENKVSCSEISSTALVSFQFEKGIVGIWRSKICIIETAVGRLFILEQDIKYDKMLELFNDAQVFRTVTLYLFKKQQPLFRNFNRTMN